MSYIVNEVSLGLPISQDVWKNSLLPMMHLSDLNVISKVSHAWNSITQPCINTEWANIKKVAVFGKPEWLKIPGINDVGEEPTLIPDETLKVILMAACPFFNQKDSIQPHRFEHEDKIKRVWQTHMLILFPMTINGEARTANSLGTLFKFLNQKNTGTVYDLIIGGGEDEYRNRSSSKPYFALVTTDVIPDSRELNYEQKNNCMISKGYRVPDANEAITAILIMNFVSLQAKRGYLFGKATRFWTYTTTSDKIRNKRLVVGAAHDCGIGVRDRYIDWAVVGVAGFRDYLC